jgi:hypothetical protein
MGNLTKKVYMELKMILLYFTKKFNLKKTKKIQNI